MAIDAFHPDAALTDFNRNRKLTAREWEVTELVVLGKTNAEISTIMGLRYGTVKQHLNRVFAKIGVSTRTALAAMWRDTLADQAYQGKITHLQSKEALLQTEVEFWKNRYRTLQKKLLDLAAE